MTESFNRAVVVVGPSEYGKSTIAREEVKYHLERYPTGRVFVHDCNVQFGDLCAVYETYADYERAYNAAVASRKPFPRGASIAGSAAELTARVTELGKRHNRADDTKVPILLVYDESSLMGTSGSTHMGQIDVELLSNRRHWGIAPVYNVQFPSAITRGFYDRATHVYMFAQTSEDDTDTLERNLGLAASSPGCLRELIGAPQYRYKLWRKGRGLVPDGRCCP